MSKAVKAMITNDLQTRFSDVSEAVMIEYAGLDAEEERVFRAELRQQGISVNVVKNTLIRRVFSDRGLDFGDALKGPTAVVWGAEDAVTASKAVADWRKKNGKELRIWRAFSTERPWDQRKPRNSPRCPRPRTSVRWSYRPSPAR